MIKPIPFLFLAIGAATLFAVLVAPPLPASAASTYVEMDAEDAVRLRQQWRDNLVAREQQAASLGVANLMFDSNRMRFEGQCRHRGQLLHCYETGEGWYISGGLLWDTQFGGVQ
jgi:hypothetical protein